MMLSSNFCFIKLKTNTTGDEIILVSAMGHSVSVAS
jgi:hypothetical protein